MNNLLQYFAPEGVWAVLSCILIFYILKNQEKRDCKQDAREEQYRTTILMLTESLKDLEEVKDILRKNLK